MPLCSDFLSVFESEPHIALAVDGDEVHHSAPKGSIKPVYQVCFCEGGKKGFNRCFAGPLAVQCPDVFFLKINLYAFFFQLSDCGNGKRDYMRVMKKFL